jgi:probable O-glycosylation ligase (exosortase A-associated)
MQPYSPGGFGSGVQAHPGWPGRRLVRETAGAAQRTIASAAASTSPYNLPFLVVLGYLTIEFGRPQNWVSSIGLLRPGLILTVLGVAMMLRSDTPSLPATGRWMIAFLSVMAAGVPFATNQHFAFNHTLTFAAQLFGAIFPVMMFVDSYRKVLIFFRVWIGLHLMLAAYGMTHSGRGMGSFLGDENDFCLAMNVILPYALFLFPVAKSWRERLLLLTAVGVYLAANVVSYSRGGFVGLVAVGIAYWLRSSRKLASALVVAVLSGSMLLLAPDWYWDEIRSIQTADEVGDTGQKRLYYWGLGWQIFLDYPILGVGPRNFEFNSYRYESEEEVARGHHAWGKAAHSLYFTLLPEGGLLGTISFGMVLLTGLRLRRGIGTAYRQLARTRPDALTDELKRIYVLAQAADVSLIAYLATGAFLSVLYYPHFWVLGAISVMLRRVFDQEIERASATKLHADPEPSPQGRRITGISAHWVAPSALSRSH